VTLLRPAEKELLPVCNMGVWHSAQPTFKKLACPLASDAALGLLGIPVEEGTAGARKRMKFAKASMSLRMPVSGLFIDIARLAPVAGKLVESSGVA
jgi:hypothetical protein